MSALHPGKAQLGTALQAARRMLDNDVDPHFLAATLLYLQARCDRLEALYQLSDRYLRFGLPEHELSEMRLLVEQIREAEAAESGRDSGENTLPI